MSRFTIFLTLQTDLCWCLLLKNEFTVYVLKVLDFFLGLYKSYAASLKCYRIISNELINKQDHKQSGHDGVRLG